VQRFSARYLSFLHAGLTRGCTGWSEHASVSLAAAAGLRVCELRGEHLGLHYADRGGLLSQQRFEELQAAAAAGEDVQPQLWHPYKD
jgi:hypothetical protein